jgi:cytochrome c
VRTRADKNWQEDIKLKKFMVLLILCIAVLSFAVHLGAKSSPAEAQKLVTKAAAYLKAQGKEKAFNEFSNTQGQFRRGELYVFVLDMKADILAHGSKRNMIGKGSFDLTDPDGKYFLKEIVDVANSKESGWVHYKWTNPMTRKVEPKTTYFQKVDDVILCSGAYPG